MTPEDTEKLRQMSRLLHEANEHAMARDGHHKSSEGYISVGFGNHWDREDPDDLRVRSVEVYSYLLGPHRMHYFDSLDQALDTVVGWHKDEMTLPDVWEENPWA